MKPNSMRIIHYLFLLGFISITFQNCTQMPPTYNSYDEYPIYQGDDLGLTYSSKRSVFKIWSPAAESVVVKIYENGLGEEPLKTLSASRTENGVWEVTEERELKGYFYTIEVTQNGKVLLETPGIYAKAVGANGKRAAIIDFKSTNPTDWNKDKKPPLNSPNEIILYELHVRDITSHPSSGSSHPKKFIGLAETGTKSPDGLATGIDHIKEMGVTHVHLLPSYDFLSVDETDPKLATFNWGYDPQNYNVPEGSYSTDPFDPISRIKEFKQMVKGFHDNGIRVILDVVYNHTGVRDESNFNLESPGYYYRQNEDGSWSDASACGNETASERPMMRKFMIESLKWWVKEYHLDGFRFDLMGIHDIETMNSISKELLAIEPSLFLYGEGWTAGTSPLPDAKKALKVNAKELENVAVFCDDLRDGIKGSVFEEKDGGILGGKQGLEETIKFGIVGATEHPQIDYQKVNYSNSPFSPQPSQTINYVSCHDNHTLYDKLKIANEDLSESDIKRLHRLANTIVLTSQGVPFLHAGVELLRSKDGEHNSYNKPDALNQINWEAKKTHLNQVKYYQKLIALRKAHPAFRMPSTEKIKRHLQFLEVEHSDLIAYQITDSANGDTWKNIIVIFNLSANNIEFNLPKGEWKLVLDTDEINESGLVLKKGGEDHYIAKKTAWVLVN